MDPEAAYRDLRDLCEELAEADDEDLDPDEVRRMAELFLGLDGWLSQGGFAPAAWAESVQKRRQAE